MDFTPSIYKCFLEAILQAGYNTFTYQEWCEGKAWGRYVILRHDVDLKAPHSLVIAKIEAELGIKATYYFRIVPSSNKPDIIRSIVELGHEIGYHYEDLALSGGDIEQAAINFEKNLNYFRQFYPVRTISMHGSPSSKWDNREIWQKYDYRSFEIIGEPYFDILSGDDGYQDYVYFTDTGRMWDGHKYNVRDKILNQNVSKSKLTSYSEIPHIHTTHEFIQWLGTNPNVNQIMINTHPQRWTDNWLEWIYEIVLQSAKNYIKQMILKSRYKTNGKL